MQPQEASFITTLVVIPAVMYVLYRTVVPFEPVMRDLRIGSSLLFPLVAGAMLGFVHIMVDPPLLFSFWGFVAFLVIYPVINTYVVLVLFNRRSTMQHAAAPIYFAIGGAGVAMGLASAESFRTLSALGEGSADAPLILELLLFSTAFVLFHCSKAAYLGTYVVQGMRRRGVLMATLMEGPLGFLFFARQVGQDDLAVTATILLFALLVYLWTWRRFFPAQMPDDLAKALRKERRRARRRRERAGGV